MPPSRWQSFVLVIVLCTHRCHAQRTNAVSWDTRPGWRAAAAKERCWPSFDFQRLATTTTPGQQRPQQKAVVINRNQFSQNAHNRQSQKQPARRMALVVWCYLVFQIQCQTACWMAAAASADARWVGVCKNLRTDLTLVIIGCSILWIRESLCKLVVWIAMWSWLK